ncbi:OLC1v1035614C1 [Oldenlandia corymbosa var. corymbosa]|uniref:OLC1v1035614C1 n=1 Tax=Oldenlandia corymbosa var. corymbosa TaxID=529605 RepID=A0AAV1CU89_OLDCO|nr:OLC1v1035614C1 [Oldenlandia corymbosa var. corymbosa]
MDRQLSISMRDAAYGLPTACPHSLGVYCYCMMAGIPFNCKRDLVNFDLDFSPKIKCNSYLGYKGIQDLIKQNVANLDFHLNEETRDHSMLMHSHIRDWLGKAATYELWIEPEHTRNSLGYLLSGLRLGEAEAKARYFRRKSQLMDLEEEGRCRKIEELYKFVSFTYDQLSTTLGTKRTFFDESLDDSRPSSLDAAFLGHAIFVIRILPETSRLRKELLQRSNLWNYAILEGEKMNFNFQWPTPEVRIRLKAVPPEIYTNWTKQGSLFQGFTFQHMQYYTKDFQEEQRISAGNFGDVFLGVVIDTSCPGSDFTGLRVAVKASHCINRSEETQWKAEIKFMSRIDHPRILKLWGHCFHQAKRMPKPKLFLVYEFMENGSVSRRLEGLDWNQTKKIAIGSAEALQVLHMQDPPIIFADFRAPNILLDKDFLPRLGDFGQAVEEDERLLCYSPGYNDPMTLRERRASKSMDVYSMGILLLQLLTKEQNPYRNNTSLAKCVPGGSAVHMSLVDTGCSPAHAELMANLGLECTRADSSLRPTMNEVVKILKAFML